MTSFMLPRGCSAGLVRESESTGTLGMHYENQVYSRPI